eukprot:m.15298 g.15298  ORF g.15298 m.15298 type:complete len:404 (-) comp4452_c0_seq1:1474-2685(-)
MSSSLYPEIEPYMSGKLRVGDPHELYYEQCGNENGFPVIFLHGGPGGGCRTDDRRFFDPRFYRIILMDQRGAGRSVPTACLEDNTTWHLVDDIEALRTTLGIEKWVVFGGSWGSTLSLTYAETHPDRVVALVLRGIFTLRRSELLWFYQDGASHLFPDVWDEYLEPIPDSERGDLMSAYYRRLTGSNQEERMNCAKAWTKWECSTSKLYMDDEKIAAAENSKFALAFARIECHYFVNGGFFSYDGQIIDNLDKIRHIPTTVVQGRYDVVCPMKTCWDLHKNFPEADVIIVDDNGHASSEPGIERELVKTMDDLRADLKIDRTHVVVSRPTSHQVTPKKKVRDEFRTSFSDTPPPSTPPQRIVRDPNFESPSRRESSDDPHLKNVLHKRPLQPPGGFSHNITFG